MTTGRVLAAEVGLAAAPTSAAVAAAGERRSRSQGPPARGMRQVAHVCDAFGAQNDAEATPMRHGFGPKRRSLRHAGEKTCCRKGLGVARRARKWRMLCTCQADGNSRRRPEVFETSQKRRRRVGSTMPENRREAPASAPVSAASPTDLRRYRREHKTPSLPGCSHCREQQITAEAQRTRSTKSDASLSKPSLRPLRRRALHIFLCNATIARAERGPRQPESHAMTSADAPQAGPGPAPGRSRPPPAPRPNEPEKLAKNNDLPAEAGANWRRSRRAPVPSRDFLVAAGPRPGSPCGRLRHLPARRTHRRSQPLRLWLHLAQKKR
jgi:hypothetical protein